MADKKILLGVDIPANAVAIVLDNSGTGKTAVFEKDDIVSETLGNIVEYSATKTKEDGNMPYLETDVVEVSLTQNGVPAPLSDSGANTTYIDILEGSGGDNGSRAAFT